MKRVLMLGVLALVAALVAAPVSAANKWVRGPVTAMTADTITVTVKGAESTFKVEASTQLIAHGAGTATKEKGGVKLGDFVKVGTYVEVRYNEAGGAKVATEVRPLANEEEGASKEKEATAAGTSAHGPVVSIAQDSVVIKADGAEVKFAVTPKTKVLGTGVGTKARELTAAGKPTPITAFIGVSDQVVVYTDAAAPTTASSIRLVQKLSK